MTVVQKSRSKYQLDLEGEKKRKKNNKAMKTDVLQ